ncbi:MAG: hypothetical protein IJ682_02295, partial [Lachnospiraceae bacterium]|nr:hypothetical protein [Lachnospiraceae bacterium]
RPYRKNRSSFDILFSDKWPYKKDAKSQVLIRGLALYFTSQPRKSGIMIEYILFVFAYRLGIILKLNEIGRL